MRQQGYKHLASNVGEMATIDQWNGDKGFFGNMSSSDNILTQFIYGSANDFYLVAQTADTFNWMGTKRSGLAGQLAYTNLDGSSQYGAGDRAVALSTLITFPEAKINLPVAKSFLKTMNAGQYNKLFKGTFVTKLTSSTRGRIYRGINQVKRESKLYIENVLEFLSSPKNTNSTYQAIKQADENRN